MGEWISIPQTCVTLNNRQKKVKRLLDSGLHCEKISRMLHVAYDVVLDKVVAPPRLVKFKSGKTMPEWYAKAWHLPADERSKMRSQTFEGIAKAMAQQWG